MISPKFTQRRGQKQPNELCVSHTGFSNSKCELSFKHSQECASKSGSQLLMKKKQQLLTILNPGSPPCLLLRRNYVALGRPVFNLNHPAMSPQCPTQTTQEPGLIPPHQNSKSLPHHPHAPTPTPSSLLSGLSPVWLGKESDMATS